MIEQTNQTRIRFLLIACFFELLLGSISLAWIHFRGLELQGFYCWDSLLRGLLLTLPLLFLNALLYYSTIARNKDSPYAQFFYEYILPLCRVQNTISALCIGIASGFGEELLFRAAMTLELQLHVPQYIVFIIVNVLFAYVHFIGSARKFVRLVLFYFLFGLYFSFIVEFYSDLWAAVICHALYNFIVILSIKNIFKAKQIKLA